MKLREIEHRDGYQFFLTFVNGENVSINLETLISPYVKPQETETANINQEWGCLEFKGGTVDVEPKTLYHFIKNHSQQIH